MTWRSTLAFCWTGLAIFSPFSQAQVTLDGTFGAAGPLTGPQYAVTAEQGLTRGNNLFHSFSQFDLQTGESATFSGPASIQNILSRVTGNAPSRIDGTIRSEIAGANFFLINPKGLLFGPNAVVDVSGSFAGSGAHYLKLADDARFVAALDADDSQLSTAPVAAFGFLNSSGGSVQVHGQLQAGPGTSLSLVGSSVSLMDGARVVAPEGDIQLQGVTSVSEIDLPARSPVGVTVGLSPDDPSRPGSVIIRGGRLVVNNATVSATTTGGDIDLSLSDSVDILTGGQILTRNSADTLGGNILIDTASLLVDGQDGPLPTRIAAETTGNLPETTGGNIIVQSEQIELRQGAEISVSSFGAANAGRVELYTQTLRLDGSDRPQFPTQISANASPVIGSTAGAGGEIVIRAEAVELQRFSGILAATTGDAAAGAVDIQANSLSLANGAVTTFTAGSGQGGEIRIQAGHLTMDGPFASITALTTGLTDRAPAGNGGLIRIDANRLDLLNDAGISANTFGDGQGGNIQIVADAILLDRATFQRGSLPGITAASLPTFFGGGQGGRGGDISIITGSLRMLNGMPISTTTATSGDGGNLHLMAQSIHLESGSSIQSASESRARAGTIQMITQGEIQFANQSFLSTSAPQSSGGDIRIDAGGEVHLTHSKITAQAGPGGGGNINVSAPVLIYLLDSTLTAQAAGDGGNLTVDPSYFILNSSGLISRSSSANGGNITIRSDVFLQSSSFIDASAPFGLPGTVSVSAPEIDLSASLVGLPGNLLDVGAQLQPDCAVRLTSKLSSFVVRGRGGLPIHPGGFLPSALLLIPNETD
jgi:filamentous hemagglutinin family protein